MFEFIRSNGPRFMEIAAEMGLTPGDMKALLSLGDSEPQPMGTLAGTWNCDASNVTWLVDRLEERGLAERQVGTKDRRVKTVALTEAGVIARDRVQERLFDPPERFANLSAEVLADLVTVLRKIEPGSAT